MQTAMLANTVAGIAIRGLLNAITRIEAASTSQGIASRKRNGPNETFGKAVLLQLPAKCDRHAATVPAEVEFPIAPLAKIERNLRTLLRGARDGRRLDR